MKKIMPKFLGIVMAIVLVAISPIFLTACGKSANFNSIAKAAAKHYFQNHVDYENFENTTYVYEINSEEKDTQELEYLINADATEKTKGNFTSTYSQKTVYKIYVVNVEEGKLAIVIDILAESTEKEYTVDENDLLKEENEVNSRHTVYKLSYITEGNETTYYLTKEYEVKEGEDVIESAKLYHEYDDVEDYIYEIEDILSHINGDMIESGYFEVATGEVALFYGNMLRKKVSGSNAKVKMGYETFYIDYAGIAEVNMEFEASFKNNKIGEVKNLFKVVREDSISNNSAVLHVDFSVKNVNTAISLAGAIESDSLYIPDHDLPRVEIGFSS